MNLIPLGTRSPLEPIRGTTQMTAETDDLTARKLQTLQYLINEDEEEYSEYDDSDSHYDNEDDDNSALDEDNSDEHTLRT